MAQAAIASCDTSVSELRKELGVTSVTLYRYVDPYGNLRDYGKRVLSAWRGIRHSPASDPRYRSKRGSPRRNHSNPSGTPKGGALTVVPVSEYKNATRLLISASESRIGVISILLR